MNDRTFKIRNIENDEIIKKLVSGFKGPEETVNTVNEALYRWIAAISQSKGWDPNTGRIVIRSPTSSRNYQVYKVTKTESDFLRKVLRYRQINTRFPMLEFNKSTNHWHFNISSGFDNAESWFGYLENNPIDNREYEEFYGY